MVVVRVFLAYEATVYRDFFDVLCWSTKRVRAVRGGGQREGRGWRNEVRYLTAEPVIENHTCRGGKVRLTALPETPCLARVNFEKREIALVRTQSDTALPLFTFLGGEFICGHQVGLFHAREKSGNIRDGVHKIFDTYYTF